MKQFITLTAFMALAFAAHAQTSHESNGHEAVAAKPTVVSSATADPASSGPDIAVAVETLALKESEFDFGKIPQGKPVTHIFEVSNTGKTPFKLDNVQASCGCTTPQWDKEKTIAPGETSQITVGYNAAAEGFFTKTITITYNGTQTKVMTIKGEVWKTPASSAPANSILSDLKN